MKQRILIFLATILIGACVSGKPKPVVPRKPIFPRHDPVGAVAEMEPEKVVCPNPNCTCPDCPCVDCKCSQPDKRLSVNDFDCPTCHGVGTFHGAMCPTCDGACNALKAAAEVLAPQPAPKVTGHWENRYSGFRGRRVEQVWVQDVPRQTTFGKAYSNCANGQCR